MVLSQLSSSFPSIVFPPESAEYKKSNGSYFAAFENEIVPLCIIRPRSTQELSQLLKYLAIVPDVDVAIRCGGHTPWGGAANAENGVTIDLENFRGIQINSANNTASFGARETWGDVYKKLGEQGLCVAGGRVSKVAVGGLTLGSGISNHSRKYGFVCDNVTEFEVVLASGEIVVANASENSDLWIALKGGSNNFGIVTKLTFRTFDQGPMWGGGMVFGPEAWPHIVEKLYDFAVSTNEADLTASPVASCSHLPQMFVGCSLHLYASDPENLPKTFQQIDSIQPQMINTLRVGSVLDFAVEQGQYSQDGARQWYFTTTFKLSKEFMLKAEKMMRETVDQAVESVTGFGLSLVLQPITVEQLRASTAHGPNSLGLSPDDGPLFNLLLPSVHINKEDDEKVINFVNGLLERLTALSEEMGIAHRWRFMNYSFKGAPVIESYGAENVEKMWAVSKKYDPEGFFQKRVPGGFKLPPRA